MVLPGGVWQPPSIASRAGPLGEEAGCQSLGGHTTLKKITLHNATLEKSSVWNTKLQNITLALFGKEVCLQNTQLNPSSANHSNKQAKKKADL